MNITQKTKRFLYKHGVPVKMKMGQASKPSLKRYKDVLTFGKYKGHTVEWVLKNNPSYLIWLRHKDYDVSAKIYTDAQALYEHECKLKAKAYSHLNHNYSSYYDDEYMWSSFDEPW